jgi:hypothetical protein
VAVVLAVVQVDRLARVSATGAGTSLCRLKTVFFPISAQSVTHGPESAESLRRRTSSIWSAVMTSILRSPLVSFVTQ